VPSLLLLSLCACSRAVRECWALSRMCPGGLLVSSCQSRESLSGQISQDLVDDHGLGHDREDLLEHLAVLLRFAHG
jgi:hypothetical protein